MGGPSRDELEAENARLGARVRELEDTIDSQAAVLAANEERFKKLEEIIEKLRRGGKRQAAPFSKGDPVLDPKKPGRKPGAAHGRHAHRPTPEAVDRELVAPLPSCCPDCGGDVEFERWAEQFLTELPDARPTVTRFKVGIGHCGACRRRVKGRHPEQTSDALGAAAVGLGPRARAMAHWLHYVLGLSFAKTAKVLGELGVGVTPAALVLAAQSTGRALVPTTRAITERVGTAPVVTMDETGWRIAGWGAWLWVATTPAYTAYNVAWGRTFTAATCLVPADYTGTVARDGYIVYANYTRASHQTCVAHLLRRCGEMIDTAEPADQNTPRRVKTLLLASLAARDLPGDQRLVEADRLGACFDRLIADPAAQANDADRRLLKHLGRERDALLTFLHIPGVEATNWRAEQAIRPAVVNRKVSGGNRTEPGAATQGRMMTYFRTAAQQGADAIDGLVALARAPDRHIIAGLGLTGT